jgi:hypothetical protein
MKVHSSAQYYDLDVVAETMGVSSELNRKLWGMITDDGVERPLDGPLYETPGDAIGQGPNILSDHWHKFTEAEQRELSKALGEED